MSCHFFDWLFSRHKREKKNNEEKLQISIRATAECRYSAAERLKKQSKFAFFTNIILSLGLIFIPLVQNAGIALAFDSKVMNMMSIFLAVSVLVYSVVIGKSRYDSRADRLTRCGDGLKELNRELDAFIETRGESDKNNLNFFRRRYSQLIMESENHDNIDYLSAELNMRNDYKITGIVRLWKYIKLYFLISLSYLLPACLLLAEILFITDMLNITRVFSDYTSNVLM